MRAFADAADMQRLGADQPRFTVRLVSGKRLAQELFEAASAPNLWAKKRCEYQRVHGMSSRGVVLSGGMRIHRQPS